MKTGALIAAVAALLLGSQAALAQSSGARMVDEEVNPSEVVFENGQAWYYGSEGRQRLSVRRHGGEDIYFRRVPAYDPETGYAQVAGDEQAAAPNISYTPFRDPSQPQKYYGNGLYGPDPFRSPYNRDARQIRSGPGYYESCSRYDGCRSIQIVPRGYGYW
ncbi:MAG: hypothetical protein QM769_06850 [Pseudoxanthomonas sp.]